MARSYKVQIGSLYLTSNALVGGTQCELTVTNVEDLNATVTGFSGTAIDLGATRNVVPWTKGKAFEVRVNVMFSTLYESLETFLNSKNEADESFVVHITGDIYDLELTVKARLSKPIARGSFILGVSNDVTLAFETV